MVGQQYEFLVGDKAVYPSHGIGTIETIEMRNIEGAIQEFYVLKIHATGAKVMVPTRSAKVVGLRSLVTANDVDSIFEILKSPSKKVSGTWNRRFRALNDKLNTGDLLEVAKVLRDLAHLKQDKDLSFGEKKMMKRAQAMIVSEICAAKNMHEDQVESNINQILGFLPDA